jgi:hypothetical protein
VTVDADTSTGHDMALNGDHLYVQSATVYAVNWTGTNAGYDYYLATSTTQKPSKASATLTLEAPRVVGDKMAATATVTANGARLGHVPVTLTWTSNGKTKTLKGTTSASGVAMSRRRA